VANGASSPTAFLTKDFSTTASKVHYAFDFQVVTYPSAGNVNANYVDLPLSDSGAATQGHVYIATSNGSTKLSEQHKLPDGGYSSPVTLAFTPPNVGVWTHLDIVVDLVALTASLSVDGYAVGSMGLGPFYAVGQVSVNAGISFTNTQVDQSTLLVDNTIAWLE
jgi:hypothetical protein